MKPVNHYQPKWRSMPPGPGTYRSIFKWGAPERFKHPNRKLYRMLKEELQLDDDHFRERIQEGDQPVSCGQPTTLSPEQVRALGNIVGNENIAADDYARVKYSCGQTEEEIFMLRRGETGAVPDLVVRPACKEHIVRIIRYCNEECIPVYVYGGGSSVNLGFRSAGGGIALDMQTHMNRVLSFNEINRTITVEPGMLGPNYEYALNHAPDVLDAGSKYTGGHFPQSFEFSTVGGWIAALGSGQQSSYYGDACDLVVSQEYVTPAGIIETHDFPHAASGPRINELMIGSEGTLGVLVAATMKIFRYMPENRKRFAYIFPSWELSVEAAREISQGEFGMPSVLRISDPEETAVVLKLYGVGGGYFEKILALLKRVPGKCSLMIGHTEGDRRFSKNVYRRIRAICRKKGGLYLSGYPVRKWENSRFEDPYLREALNDFGIVIDTLETTVTWDKLQRVHNSVRAFIKERPHTICMTHSSHFYAQGTNLYFIFIAKTDTIEEYKTFQEGIIERIEVSGGSLSHHHGVGKMMAPWMERHLGAVQMGALRACKSFFDPHNIMNPGGTLGLDLPPDKRR